MRKQSGEFDKFKTEMSSFNKCFERALVVPPVVPFLEEGASTEFTRDVSNTLARFAIHNRQRVSPGILKKVIEDRIGGITPAIKSPYAVTLVNAKNKDDWQFVL